MLASASCGIDAGVAAQVGRQHRRVVTQLSVTRSLGKTPFISAGRKTTSHSRPLALCTVSSLTASRSDGHRLLQPGALLDLGLQVGQQAGQ